MNSSPGSAIDYSHGSKRVNRRRSASGSREAWRGSGSNKKRISCTKRGRSSDGEGSAESPWVTFSEALHVDGAGAPVVVRVVAPLSW